MRAPTVQAFAALVAAAGLAACPISGVADNGSCNFFSGICFTDADCCPGLVCSQTGVCAFPDIPDGGSGSGGTSGGATSSGGSRTGSGGSGSSAASSSSSTSGSTTVASSSSGFAEAAHSEPSVPKNSGPVIAIPVLVTITYSDDGNRSTEEGFDAFLVTSSWLSTVGAEYGVAAGTNVDVELPSASPGSLDQNGVVSDIAALIQAGTAPGLPSANGVDLQNAIYLIFYPSTVQLSVNGQLLCNFAHGYHSDATLSGGQAFSYAVVQDCPPPPGFTDVQAVESAASHEFIESATDPLPTTNPAWMITDTTNPWHGVGGEIGDLCEAVLPAWSEGGYTDIQRIFSNSAAAAGGDPCLPLIDPYYGTDAVAQGAAPQTVAEVNAGAQVVFTLTGWSTAPVAAWNVKTGVISGTFSPTLTASVTMLDNGLTGTLTVGVPASASSGDFVVIEVGSEQTPANNTGTFIGVAVQ